VLEASPLPEMNAVGLGKVSLSQDYFTFDSGEQSAEDAALFAMSNRISYQSKAKRYPFVLLLEGVASNLNRTLLDQIAYHIFAA
jgi:hypothetical protein